MEPKSTVHKEDMLEILERRLGKPFGVLTRQVVEHHRLTPIGRTTMRSARVAVYARSEPTPHWLLVTLDIGPPMPQLSLRARRTTAEPEEVFLAALDQLTPELGMRASFERGALTLCRALAGGITFVSDADLSQEKAPVAQVVHLQPSEYDAALAIVRRPEVGPIVAELGRRSPSFIVDPARAPVAREDLLRLMAEEAQSDEDAPRHVTFLYKRCGFLWRRARLAMSTTNASRLAIAIPLRFGAGRSAVYLSVKRSFVFRTGSSAKMEQAGNTIEFTLDDRALEQLVSALDSPSYQGTPIDALPNFELMVEPPSEFREYFNTLNGPPATRRF